MINLVIIRDFSSLWPWLARSFREAFNVNYSEVIKNIKAFPKFIFERLSLKVPFLHRVLIQRRAPSVGRWGINSVLSGSEGAGAFTVHPLSMLGKEPARLLLPQGQNHRDRPSSTVFISCLRSQSSKSKAGKPAAVVSDKKLFLALNGLFLSGTEALAREKGLSDMSSRKNMNPVRALRSWPRFEQAYFSRGPLSQDSYWRSSTYQLRG